LKLELIGFGFLSPLMPISITAETETAYQKLKAEPLSERINGISLSATGSTCSCLTNGITAGLIGQLNFQVNGISASLFINFMQKMNGLQMAVLNETYILNGLQIGLSNTGYVAKGMQIGAGNFGDETTGIQIGILNKTKHLKGIQIGLWNVNQKRKLPLINWSFK
jgi:hypothetical protein